MNGPDEHRDGVHDMANMPLQDEPQRVRDDRNTMLARRPSGAAHETFDTSPRDGHLRHERNSHE